MPTLIIIPCFNEEENIERVLKEAANLLPWADLLVINDASTDKTYKKALKCPKARVMNLPVNLGVGGAVQTGLRYAFLNGYSLAVKLDGDGQHNPADIKRLLEPLRNNSADIVIGSRFMAETPGFRSTAMRRLGIFIISKVCLMLTGQKITDPTSGFRAYNKHAIAFMARHYPSFDYPEPEEIILACKNSFRLSEVETNMRPRMGGVSSISSVVSVYYMVKVITAMIFVSIRKPLACAKKDTPERINLN